MSKNRHFQTIFLSKLALLVALAREKVNFIIQTKNLKGESSKSARKTAKGLKAKQVARDVASLAL